MYRSMFMGLVALMFLLAQTGISNAVQRDKIGASLKNLSIVELSELADEADAELGEFERTIKGAGYTGEILMDGTVGGENTYIVIGLNQTGETVADELTASGSDFQDMVVNFPGDLNEAFLKNPVATARETGSNAAANAEASLNWFADCMENSGAALRVHKAYGVPLAAGHAVVATVGGAYYLVLRLPVEVAIDVTKGLLRSSWRLVRDPVTGTLHLGAAALVGTYGTASSVTGAVITGSITVVAATLEGVALLLTAPGKLLRIIF